MKHIRFVSDDPLQKEFATNLNKNVYNYFSESGISIKGNAIMFVKTVMMLLIYVVPFIIFLTIPINGLLGFFLVVLMGIGEAGIGMCVMHDAAHGAFSRKEWVNNLFASTMYMLGSNTFNWKVQHNIFHHTYTNTYGYDQDIETKSILRLSPHATLKKIHKYQYIYAFFLYGLMTLSKLVTDFGQLIEYNKTGVTEAQQRKPRIELMKLVLTKIIYLSIIIGLPILFSGFKWWQVLIGFAILHITAGIIMSTIFQMAHVVEGPERPLPNTEGVIENEWIVHELRTTSNFAPNNYFLNWFVGGLNFQIEHHLFPNICHIHYSKIAPIVERTAAEFGLIYNRQPTFVDALKSHIQRLKSLGESNYVA